jgi:hypothetical protein
MKLQLRAETVIHNDIFLEVKNALGTQMEY